MVSDMEKNISKKTLALLEYDKIINMLSDLAQSVPGKTLCSLLSPETRLENVEKLLAETTGAKNLLRLKGMPSFSNLTDISPHIQRLEAGAALSMAELLDISRLLRCTFSLIRYKGENETDFSSLDEYFSFLSPNKHLEERISSAIISDEQMSDRASGTLYDIRRKISNAEQRVRDVLNSFLHSSKHKKHLQDELVTIKNGRYVLPVKSESRGEIPGLVHESSSSGATLFIEPMGVVDANNEIRVLKSKETAEIERILSQLSAETAEFLNPISKNFHVLSSLDAIFARARFSETLNAEPPILNLSGGLYLKNARHPLLDKKTAVPIDISVGKDHDSLIITGPNTGGKTVSLKTAGLLSLMAQSGMHIPAEHGSRLPVYKDIFADIGDEQSIEQSLSTFSSHMVNIVDILKKTGPEKLILLDELGAGTDPVEGAALAIAIIEHIRNSKASLIATTHYPELKIYALETPNVENASCEFDIKSLKPTYRLITGVPGRSNALAIAARLGMPQSVTESAKLHLNAESVKFERVIENLEQNRRAMEFESKKAAELKREAAELKNKAQKLLDDLEAKKEKHISQAKNEALSIVEEARESSRRIIKELNELRQKADSDDFRARLDKARDDSFKALSDMEKTAGKPLADDKYILPRPLKIGDTVKISGINKEATVTALPDSSGYVTIKAGIVNTKVPIQKLRLIEYSSSTQKKGYVSKIKAKETVAAKTELDIRGMAMDEAPFAIDAFLDTNTLAGLNTVTIIHGKGTGALRTAVHKHLKSHPQVKSFRLGTFGEGEMGVTVVELK